MAALLRTDASQTLNREMTVQHSREERQCANTLPCCENLGPVFCCACDAGGGGRGASIRL